MKRIPLLAAAAVLSVQFAQAASLDVSIRGQRTDGGTLQVLVAGSAGAWTGEASPAAATTLAVPGSGNARFELEPGRYAIKVVHDENGNGKLDTNFMGMPVEGYGFSNNPRVMRMPTFEEAAFELGQDGASLVIELR